MIDPTAVTGIRDPHDPGRWLVLPWPVEAGFCEVVRHFLPAHVGLLGDQRTARQVAFFEGYQAALLAASTDDLCHPTAWRWRDELLGWVARCVAGYRAERAERPAPERARAARDARPSHPIVWPGQAPDRPTVGCGALVRTAEGVRG